MAIIGLLPIRAQASKPTIGEVKQIVAKYCAAEFDGKDLLRAEVVGYSQKMQHGLDPMFIPGVFFIDNDPIKIIRSYSVQQPTPVNSGWSVVVDYLELGERLNPAYKHGVAHFHESPLPASHTIRVKNVRGKLLVFDPPIPCVGLQAFLQYYSKSLESSEKHVLPNKDASSAQLEEYRRRKAEYEDAKLKCTNQPVSAP